MSVWYVLRRKLIKLIEFVLIRTRWQQQGIKVVKLTNSGRLIPLLVETTDEIPHTKCTTPKLGMSYYLKLYIIELGTRNKLALTF